MREAARRIVAILAVTVGVVAAFAAAAVASGGATEGAARPWVIGYYPWYEAGPGVVPPEEFPYRKVTHVAIGSVLVTGGRCCTVPKSAETTWPSYALATVTRAHRAHTKVLLQLGGSDNAASGWRQGTASPRATSALAASIVSFARGVGADGVALDWELEVDLGAVGRLAAAVRRLWPAAALTVDVDPYDSDLSWVGAVAPHVDRIDAMTYVSVGNWGGWQGPWHQGALRGDTPDNPVSVERKVRALRAAGLPPAKIGIGIGLFGSGYGDANGDGRCPTSPTGGWEGEGGVWVVDSQLTLADVDRLYAPSMRKVYDPVAQVPYLTAPAPGAGGEADGWPPKLCYLTYEDPRSAAAKGAYARREKLGAVIFWTVPQDRRANGTYPVIDALDRGLAGR